MEGLVFAEPTGRRARQTGADIEIAAALKGNPGEWAIIQETPLPAGDDEETAAKRKKLRASASNRASLIRQGRLKSYAPKDEFDAVSNSVTLPDGTEVSRVYAMYKVKDQVEAPAATN